MESHKSKFEESQGSVGVQEREHDPFLPGSNVLADLSSPAIAQETETDGILANEGGVPSPGVNEYVPDVDGDGDRDGDAYFAQVDTPAPTAGNAARQRYRRPFRSQHAIGSAGVEEVPDFDTKAARARQASISSEAARQAERQLSVDRAREEDRSL